MTTLRRCLAASLLVASAAVPAAAEPVSYETLIHETTTNVSVKLDESSVLCSSADYGALYLKILIPDLAHLTLLDHQNTGAGAPCVAAGPCEPGNEPSDIIDSADPDETVAVRVRAIRQDLADASAQTCDTYLVETVDVTIRGKDFTHQRTAPLGSRAFADCATETTIVEPGEGSGNGSSEGSGTGSGAGPGDGAGSGDPDPVTQPGGGCDAGGGSSTAVLGILLGAALLTRRRAAV